MNTPFDLENFIPFRLNRAAEQTSLRFARIYKQSHGMTRPEWRTLANLGQHGRLTAKEIATLSGQHKTKVSRAVASLEKRKWLQREVNPHDRREARLELTPAGRDAFEELAAQGQELDAALLKALGRDGRNALLEALDALEALGSASAMVKRVR